MSYDFEKWVDNDIAAARHGWVRWACLVPFAALPASFAMEVAGRADTPGGSLLSALLTVAGMVAAVTALFSPYARYVWRPSWKAQAPALDERERMIVAQAHARAYAVLIGALLLIFLYAWLAMGRGWWLPRDTGGLESLLRTTLLPLVVLPIAFAEWSLPPPPDDLEQ